MFTEADYIMVECFKYYSIEAIPIESLVKYEADYLYNKRQRSLYRTTYIDIFDQLVRLPTSTATVWERRLI